MEDGGRLALISVVGFLLIMIAITGRLGSILASVVAPGDMSETPAGSAATGLNPGATANLPKTGTLNATQIGQYAILAGFSDQNALTVAIAIALAESSGQIAVTHKNMDGSTDYGLWQINSVHSSYSPARLLTPLYNAQAAYNISGSGSNWNPWTTYTTGVYQKFLSEARNGAVAAAEANVGI